MTHQDAIKLLKSSDTLMLTVRIEEVLAIYAMYGTHAHVSVCIKTPEYVHKEVLLCNSNGG